MADKVVQLVDKDNNNVYPIAGALAQGSVNTSTINDEAVTAEKIDFTTLAFGNYSTSEQSTGFTWVDGKTIYKKTINFGALPNTSYKAVAHGITNLDYVIEINGIAYDGNRFRPLIMPNATSGEWSAPEADNTDIYIYTGTDQSGRTAYVTLYYTKSS